MRTPNGEKMKMRIRSKREEKKARYSSNRVKSEIGGASGSG